MRGQPPRSTLSSSSAASDVYKRQGVNLLGQSLINEGKLSFQTNSKTFKLNFINFLIEERLNLEAQTTQSFTKVVSQRKDQEIKFRQETTSPTLFFSRQLPSPLSEISVPVPRVITQRYEAQVSSLTILVSASNTSSFTSLIKVSNVQFSKNQKRGTYLRNSLIGGRFQSGVCYYKEFVERSIFFLKQKYQRSSIYPEFNFARRKSFQQSKICKAALFVQIWLIISGQLMFKQLYKYYSAALLLSLLSTRILILIFSSRLQFQKIA
eukprot:TRINITY_DN29328_c0_g1_i1.p1 TRINITY_DN29328_c0_g1~~TRINITY_DN29328_c0_g1_i1.p1  ORF type:complete len:266 (-),score=21.44 TRINITY_DN29328_c0_g1_i1:270-1067(-)